VSPRNTLPKGDPASPGARAKLHPITRARYDRARLWAEGERELLAGFSCCPRVFLVVAALMEDEDGYVSGPTLSHALSTKRVVGMAVDLLTEIGVECDDCERVGLGPDRAGPG
jgi:hypothetical protein